VDQPNGDQPSADEPDAANVGAAEPDEARAAVVQANADEPDVVNVPVPAKAAVVQANADKADVAEAVVAEAVVAEAVVKPNVDRLQMIQGVITRLAANSGALKGFAVPVITALLGVAVDKNNKGFAWLAIYPVIVFGVLDAYYLALEKKYRDLYKKATTEPDTKWGLAADKANWKDVLDSWKSPSVWLFYLAALVVVIAVALIL
jgi:hypothetical protein